ncbi:hypothetical protein O7598_31145 [Micromonospora sp. WMMC241]|uniref:hypothetical protein n=1 Tax=Micromonospora sp. WMMC241 TaxID=3015159 RepID=UPI0022B63C15|nr:hypothetical protein [Micromonospora sp. WMMC241]MCZ7440791.1 hypothetical protein [Micromonospora sp. WMMC241]MCZ7440882.1 hypothetical protein [Micromonospora sp. WMMC241]
MAIRTTIRRWAIAAALTAGAGLGLAAYDAATHAASADDKPQAAAERPGGTPDRGLPGESVRKLVDAVTDVVPVKVDKPEPPAKDEPAEEPATPPAPKPEPTREAEPEPTRPAEPEPTTPTRDTDRAPDPEPEPIEAAPEPEPSSPTPALCDVPLVNGICQTVEDVTEVVDEVVPPVTTPPVVVDVPPVVVTVPPVIVDVPPLVVDVPPIAVILPSTQPATLPDAEALPAQPQPAPGILPRILPTILGPTIGHTIATAALTALGELPAALLEDPPPECGELVSPTDAHYQALLDRLTALAQRPQPSARPKPGCPGTPGQPDHPEAGCDNATTSNTGGDRQAGQPTGDLAGTIGLPAHGRLDHLRARSQLPESRHTCIEPGPA